MSVLGQPYSSPPPDVVSRVEESGARFLGSPPSSKASAGSHPRVDAAGSWDQSDFKSGYKPSPHQRRLSLSLEGCFSSQES